MIRFFFLFSFYLSGFNLLAQNDTLSISSGKSTEKILFINGYIKDLRTISFSEGLNNILVDNLIHHRLNTEFNISKTFDLNLEFRNRIFYGEVVRLNPFYQQLIDLNNDYFDLSIIPVIKNSLILHMMIDRAYFTFTKKKWEIRTGRQRINWGINTVWNPNDLFNAYSFFDFDYEERPGSDAIRISWHNGVSSGVEVAAKAADDFDSTVAAFLIKTNKWSYDFQFLGGISTGDAVIGAGWAGNIKTAGFKGELSYFRNYKNFNSDKGVFISAVTTDYSFKNSLYSALAFLYNSQGTDNAIINELINFNISAKNLSPFRFTFFAQSVYPVTPIFNTSLAVMYSPGGRTFFINPSIAYSLAENWDLDLLGQIFFKEDKRENNSDEATLLFIRLKWSY